MLPFFSPPPILHAGNDTPHVPERSVTPMLPDTCRSRRPPGGQRLDSAKVSILQVPFTPQNPTFYL